MTQKVELTPELMLGFSNLYLRKGFDEPVETPAAHLDWWGLVTSPRRYVAIAAPRNHAKSTAISHVYVLANVCFRTKSHVLIVSDTEGQAAMFVGNIKKELMENQDLRATFGVKKLLKDTDTEVIIQWEDGKKTRVFARGAGQAIRGVNWEGSRPDLVVGDDLENDEAVMNIDRRNKFAEWFLKVLLPLGSKSCIYRIVGTILHEDSLLAGLMPNVIDDPACVIEPLQISTPTPRAWLSVLYRAHPDFDDFSEVLWPTQWTEEALREVQQAYIDQGKPESYAQEYLNAPNTAEGSAFDENDLIPILIEELTTETRSPETFYIGVDLAISKEARRAYTVFAVVGKAPDNVLRVREVIRKRMDSLEIVDTVFNLYEKYRRKSHLGQEPSFLIEKENIAKAVGPFLNEQMTVRDLYPMLELMPPIKDKEMRAQSIAARIQAHMVEFDHTAPWWPTLKHEMVTFPRSTYSDQVDALAWVGYHVANMQEAPSWDDINDYEYEDEYAEAEYESGAGKNYFTGY